MNVKVKLVNKHKSATADLWHYSGRNTHTDTHTVHRPTVHRPTVHGTAESESAFEFSQ